MGQMEVRSPSENFVAGPKTSFIGSQCSCVGPHLQRDCCVLIRPFELKSTGLSKLFAENILLLMKTLMRVVELIQTLLSYFCIHTCACQKLILHLYNKMGWNCHNIVFCNLVLLQWSIGLFIFPLIILILFWAHNCLPLAESHLFYCCSGLI